MIKIIFCAVIMAALVLSMTFSEASELYPQHQNQNAPQETKRQRIIDDYYRDYLISPPARQKTKIEIQFENDYYSNYLEEVKIIIN